MDAAGEVGCAEKAMANGFSGEADGATTGAPGRCRVGTAEKSLCVGMAGGTPSGRLGGKVPIGRLAGADGSGILGAASGMLPAMAVKGEGVGAGAAPWGEKKLNGDGEASAAGMGAGSTAGLLALGN